MFDCCCPFLCDRSHSMPDVRKAVLRRGAQSGEPPLPSRLLHLSRWAPDERNVQAQTGWEKKHVRVLLTKVRSLDESSSGREQEMPTGFFLDKTGTHAPVLVSILMSVNARTRTSVTTPFWKRLVVRGLVCRTPHWVHTAFSSSKSLWVQGHEDKNTRPKAKERKVGEVHALQAAHCPAGRVILKRSAPTLPEAKGCRSPLASRWCPTTTNTFLYSEPRSKTNFFFLFSFLRRNTHQLLGEGA